MDFEDNAANLYQRRSSVASDIRSELSDFTRRINDREEKRTDIKKRNYDHAKKITCNNINYQKRVSTLSMFVKNI